ncbi:MAG TPA: hypothetical protein VIS06_08615 [Mycobacteriales bacterium]
MDSTEERGGVTGSAGPDGLVDQLVDRARAGGLRLTGEGGVLQQLTKRLLKLGVAVQPTDVRTFERAAAEYLATLVDAQKRTAAEHRRDLNTHVRPAVVDYRTGGGSVRGPAAGRPVRHRGRAGVASLHHQYHYVDGQIRPQDSVRKIYRMSNVARSLFSKRGSLVVGVPAVLGVAIIAAVWLNTRPEHPARGRVVLEGGFTAVRPADDAGYLKTPITESVTPGGLPVPKGSFLFKLGPGGEQLPIRML